MILYCIRHGQTTYNASGRVQGQVDVPLSDLGQMQAEALREALEWLPIDAIYSSPLRRAVDTARPLADRLRLQIQTDPRLMEIHAGVFQNQSRDALETLYPEEFARWRSGDDGYRIPGGELRRDLTCRGMDAFRAIRCSGHAQAVVVTHGGLLISTMQALLCIPPQLHAFTLENASITQLMLDEGQCCLVSLNEVRTCEVGLTGGKILISKIASISTAAPKGRVGAATGAAGRHAGLDAEDLGKQLAAAVDHRRLPGELRRAVDHAEELHHPPHTIQAAQRRRGAWPGSPGRPAGRLRAGLLVQVGAHAAGDQRAVGGGPAGAPTCRPGCPQSPAADRALWARGAAGSSMPSSCNRASALMASVDDFREGIFHDAPGAGRA